MAWSSRISFAVILVTLSVASQSHLYAQPQTLTGRVTDTSGIAIQGATVYLPALQSGVATRPDGTFSLPLPAGNHDHKIIISFLGYLPDTLVVSTDDAAGSLQVMLLPGIVAIEGVQVTASRPDNITVIAIPVSAGVSIPSVTGGIESAVATLPGVASFSELSYSYSVRGGSYDENLVYINDVEIYRPYLIRAGQQEGLSRINPDLTASVSFSPGGFSAAYGDRLSSVLDITYREPQELEGSLSPGLITSSMHAGGRSRDKKFWFIAGARYRSNAMLLGSLDTRADYIPRFADLQAMAGYKTGDNSELTLSLWGSSNRYTFIPRSRTTTFGTIENAFRLYAWFEGGERDRYDNGGAALKMVIRHNERVTTKILLSSYIAHENESYDIRGAYSLSSLDRTEGPDSGPDTLLNAGAGSWLTHARNTLRTGMTGLSYRGYLNGSRNGLEWGVTAKHRSHDIGLNEWLRVDSAGYTLREEAEGVALTSYTDRASNISSFIAEGWIISRSSFNAAGKKCDLNAGIRASYDTYNSELLLSPRISLIMALTGRLSLYLSTGAYHQPPGGREMMLKSDDPQLLLRAQRSLHLTAGSHYDFIAWDRPFRFTAEVYGKVFDRLIPYTVDNVRLIYRTGNVAEGYSAGLDLRVNGEFVKGAESWFSLSLMRSEMRIPSASTGWYPAPFDQRVSFSIFFQDYLPGHPDFRANINIAIGTGIPTSPPGREQWDVWFRIPPYRRIDIGFSKVLIGQKKNRENFSMKELVAGIELFNLADIRNTISYTWIRTVRNSEGQTREYAVPNYLTGRMVNLRLTARF
ncbi:MAG: carboxypeptidase regulatory-like domain-containing protein [Bacteroidales bacterium]|nr:carboxypeptidase regulatory-like domain-containing protein [Bacteroidales bacterium]MDT8372806.1 carboxypeptidase regulatory-like domain-containing protein [Bacteroidales bacterium]